MYTSVKTSVRFKVQTDSSLSLYNMYDVNVLYIVKLSGFNKKRKGKKKKRVLEIELSVDSKGTK